MKASDNEFPSVLLAEQGATPTTPAAGFWRAYAKSDGLYVVDDAGTETGPFGTGPGGGGSLTGSMNQLAADVSMPTSNTYYDGPSLSLAAGTYLILGTVTLFNGAAGTNRFTVKLWNGTTVLASTQHYTAGSSTVASLSMSGYVVVAGTETWKISAASNVNNATILKAANANGAGDNASTLTAIKIA